MRFTDKTSKEGLSMSQIKQMKKQQKMPMLGYEVWSEKAQTYVPAEIPEEPTLSLKLCVDIKAYAKHDPPFKSEVTCDWYNICVRITGENKQVDMDIKATADTGAQCSGGCHWYRSY